MKALLVYPTHKNCHEVEEDYLAAGINAATYPGRTTEDSEQMPKNCWNTDADRAEVIGLPVVKTICPGCKSRSKCLACGYLGQIIAVEKADLRLCTHKRAEFSSLREMSSECQYVSVHENPVDVLRPAVSISEQDLIVVQRIVERLLNEPYFLDWFGDAAYVDDNGNRVHDKELEIRKDRQYQFCLHVVAMIEYLVAEFKRVETTSAWMPAKVMKCPSGIERTFFIATRITKATFQGEAWRFVLAAATGELESAAIIVRGIPRGAAKGTRTSSNRFVALRVTRPRSARPPGSTTQHLRPRH